jgi:hypothetical protein
MRTRKQIEAEIAALQEELDGMDQYDWDYMSDEQLAELFKEGTFGGWNDWENCPVGTLLPESMRSEFGNCPKDHILMHLGEIIGAAVEGRWRNVVYFVREVARIRIQQLKSE